MQQHYSKKMKLKRKSRILKKCQLCKSDELDSIIFLGCLPPVNHLHSIGKLIQEDVSFPLELVRCKSCELVQINVAVDKKVLFPFSYPYLSGTTKILTDNFYDLFKEVEKNNVLI